MTNPNPTFIEVTDVPTDRLIIGEGYVNIHGEILYIPSGTFIPASGDSKYFNGNNGTWYIFISPNDNAQEYYYGNNFTLRTSIVNSGSSDEMLIASVNKINTDLSSLVPHSGNFNMILDDAVSARTINSDVAGSGLMQDIDGSLKVNVDDVTLQIVSDVVKTKNVPGQLMTKAAAPITLGGAADWYTSSAAWYTIRNGDTPAKYLEYNYTAPADGILLFLVSMPCKHAAAAAIVSLRIWENAAGIQIPAGWAPSPITSASYFLPAFLFAAYPVTKDTAYEFKAQFYLAAGAGYNLTIDRTSSQMIILPWTNP
ncbi:MAG: hypothetical protein WC476_01210 [Phycisphaerae bacterium]|jgi:hypothetical protein